MLSGTKLGRYEIRNKIGAGGMGEVFLAQDEQLDRKVALKVLLPEFCCDSERVQRFKMEAKAASALNHPNIITIYEINDDCDKTYIATEMVEGETVRTLIDGGGLRQFDAIKIAEQVADALAVAHEAGIIHRDIKPENVMVRHDGIVKILDFGLAKPIFQTNVGAEDETVQMVQTQPGIVMGSVRYMSPEQARGKETDERTDVWSLGVVLYEMLTGKNPFEGETISDSLAAVIHVEPAQIEDVPEELQRIIRKSLKKRAEDRYQSIKDFALDLRDLRSDAIHQSTDNSLGNLTKTVSVNRHNTSENETLIHHTVSAENQTTNRSNKFLSKTGSKSLATQRSWRFLPVVILSLAVILALGGWFFLPKLLGSNANVFQSIQASRLTNNGASGVAEISPDGRFVAFVNRQEGKQSLVVKQIAANSFVTVVQPTLMNFYQPSFTPDGDFIYYILEDKGIGTLYKVSTLGGESTKITVDVDSKVTFSPDGKRFAFIRHNPNEGGDTIFTANSDGTNIEPFIKTKDFGYDRFTGVDWSPDGEKMLVAVFKNGGEANQRLKLVTVSLTVKKIEPFGNNTWLGAKSFEWTKDGNGVVLVGKSNAGENTQVWHLSYPGGEARQITTDTSDYGSVSVSADGNSLVTTRVDTISSIWSFNPQTREMRQITGENKNLHGYAGLSQMPDGRILFVKNTDKDVHIFSMDENGGNEKQLTTGTGQNVSPIATPDGKYIVFCSNRDGDSYSVWRMNADAANPVKLSSAPNFTDGMTQITADGKYVLFMRQTSDGGNSKIMKVSIEGGEAVPLLPASSKSEYFPLVSPDNKKIVYHTFDYDGKTGDIVSSIKIVGFDGEKIDKSVAEKDLKLNPDYKWSPDSKFLTYINRSGIPNLWSVSLDDQKRETPLTDFNSGIISNFVWSKDGKKLFIVRSVVNSDLVLIKDSNKV